MYAYPMDSVVTYAEDGTPQYDRAVDSSQLRELHHALMTDGVLLNDSSNLQVSASANMDIVVNPGLCHIQGCIKKFTEDTPITIASANATMSRIDTVVARLDLNSNYRDIGIFVIQGTPASVPTRPELTRNTSVYEIALADITISANATTLSQANISDTRLDTNRCGIISAIAQFDTTKLYEQIESDLLQFQESNETDFEEWFGYIRDQLSEDAAGHLQNQIDDHIAEDSTTEDGAHGFRYFEGKLQAHIYDEESMTLKWVTVPGSGLSFDNSISGMSANNVQGAIDELKGTIGYSKKNLLENKLRTVIEKNGLHYTPHEDGSFTLSGTPTTNTWLDFNFVDSSTNVLDVGEYILSGAKDGVKLCIIKNGDYGAINEEGETLFTIEEGLTSNWATVWVGQGTVLNNVRIYPMIRYASIKDGTFEPHISTVKKQIEGMIDGTKPFSQINLSDVTTIKNIGEIETVYNMSCMNNNSIANENRDEYVRKTIFPQLDDNSVTSLLFAPYGGTVHYLIYKLNNNWGSILVHSYGETFFQLKLFNGAWAKVTFSATETKL